MENELTLEIELQQLMERFEAGLDLSEKQRSKLIEMANKLLTDFAMFPSFDRKLFSKVKDWSNKYCDNLKLKAELYQIYEHVEQLQHAILINKKAT